MKKIFAANWKLHKTPVEARDFFHAWRQKTAGFDFAKRELVFFPSATSLESASQALAGSGTFWGAQNCYFEDKGAYTGEISPLVLKGMGATYVLVGHSERRSLFGETDELLAKKIKKLQDLGLTPMFCIGETLQERQGGKTFEVLKRQVEIGLSQGDRTKPLVIAYEPVWAIGTGVVATPEQVRETHAALFELLQTMRFSSETPLLYGGSVKADNARELIQIPHVDGFLVGGASLEVDSFLAIAQA